MGNFFLVIEYYRNRQMNDGMRDIAVDYNEFIGAIDEWR